MTKRSTHAVKLHSIIEYTMSDTRRKMSQLSYTIATKTLHIIILLNDTMSTTRPKMKLMNYKMSNTRRKMALLNCKASKIHRKMTLLNCKMSKARHKLNSLYWYTVWCQTYSILRGILRLGVWQVSHFTRYPKAWCAKKYRILCGILRHGVPNV